MGDESCREAHDGSVEAYDQHLGVCCEGVGDVEVEGDKGLEPGLVRVLTRGGLTGECYISSSVVVLASKLS